MSESTWAEILSAPDGPGGVYTSIERVILVQARDPENARGSLSLAGEVIATKTLLRDISRAKAFVEAIAPVFKVEGELLEMIPDMEPPMCAAKLAAVEIVSETVRAPLRLPTETQLPQRLSDALTNDPSDEEQLTIGLLSLLRKEFARIDKYLFSSKEVQSLISDFRGALKPPAKKSVALDAFDRYLRAFPTLLAAQEANWTQLLLAATLVLGDLGGVPRGDVAETLRKKVHELAA